MLNNNNVKRDSEYDYNLSARILFIEDSCEVIDDCFLNNLIEKYNLNHGDVVNFSDYRFVSAKIVYFNKDENDFEWIDNPDVKGAGYLTIPVKITKPSNSALKKYRSVIYEINYMNIELAPSDEFVKLILDDIPEDAIVWFDFGDFKIECASILYNEKWEDIEDIERLNQIAKRKKFL